MKDRPEVSVIIPCYNSSATIARAIESVLSQDSVSKEIVLVDDGSSDDTSVIARSIAGSELRIHRLNGPSGTARARNEGLNLARGNWIQFLDADDTLRPSKFRSQLELSPGVEIVYSGWHIILDGKVVEKQAPVRLVQAKDKVRLLLQGNRLHSASPLVRKSLVDRVGGFDENLYHEDWEFWIRVFLSDVRSAYCQGYLSSHHRSETGKSWSTVRRLEEDLNLLEHLVDRPALAPYRQVVDTAIRNKRLDYFSSLWAAGKIQEAMAQLEQMDRLGIMEKLAVATIKSGLLSGMISRGVGPKKLKRRLGDYLAQIRK